MKKYIFIAIFGLVLYSCEKEQETQPPVYYDIIPGAIRVEFVNNVRLKSAFELVNNFHLGIVQVYSSLYVSKLPADSIDYIVAMLNTKPYLTTLSWKIRKDGDVYINTQTGKINLVCQMFEMDETRETDWAITASVLGLEEQPSPKEFDLKVPVGQENYWCNKFRTENIVSQAELFSMFYY